MAPRDRFAGESNHGGQYSGRRGAVKVAIGSQHRATEQANDWTKRGVIQQPVMETERLLLRPLTPDDAPALARLAGRREIADTTTSIPHPYSEEQARQWIAGNVDLFAKGNFMVFA